MATPSLVRCLRSKMPRLRDAEKARAQKKISDLQLRMLRVQQGVWHRKRRAIIVFEGFDAAGKGGAIRRLTEDLDPRGIHVWPVGPPLPEEQGRHYLYRFWTKLPEPGTIAVFDRSWYGRVLVERVEGLTPSERWKAAYSEINEFERMLTDDGVDLVKIFLAISPKEQLERFEERLNNPYKHWKLGEADIRSRAHWDGYVKAAEEMLRKTHCKSARWHVIPADDKSYARLTVLKTVTDELASHRLWMETEADKRDVKTLKSELKRLGKIQTRR